MNEEEQLLEGLCIENSDERQEMVHTLPRRHSRGGYNRNACREQDKQHYYARRRKTVYVLPSVVFVVVAAAVLWWPFTNQPHGTSEQQANAVSIGSLPEVVPLAGVSDQVPAANYRETYKVAANRPRILSIESLGLTARVFEVGRDGRSQPQLAKNSYDVGWYNVGVEPGEEGAVVVSGACSGSVGQGAFHRLDSLQDGDVIGIEKGDRTMLRYVIVARETVAVDAVDMTKVLSPAHQAAQGLNLIGCTGSYDEKTNDFAGRIIIYATLDLTK